MFATAITDSLNKLTSVPAPIGGLNARDPIVAMAPTDAIVLRNWWPQPYGCSMRGGYQKWAEGLSDAVHSLATSSLLNGTRKFYAWAEGDFYDITAAGPVGTAIYDTLTDAPWQSVQIVNAAGAHLVAVNGYDNGIIVSEGVPARIIVGDGSAANTWAGLDPQKAIQVTIHQHRLWAVEKSTTNGWFLPPDAVQGIFKKVDFGPLFSRGGFLLFLATWTMDDGNGAEDHLVGFSSEGEAVVFAGTDPEDDTKWSLVGVYYLGPPVAGRRTYTKVGGDLIILTQAGAQSMTETLVSTKVENAASKLKSDKIQYLLSELTTQYAGEFGWEVEYFASANMLLVNVPTPVADGNIQLASNQLINAWTQFTNMDATTWLAHSTGLLFGDYSGNVWRAWYGHVDKVDLTGTGGSGIIGVVQQAYSYFNAPVSQKQVGLYRPNFVVSLPVNFYSTIVYDFKSVPNTAPDPIKPPSSSLWDVAFWNQGSWGGGTYVQRAWIAAEGMGNAASIQIALRSTGEVLWVSTDYSLVNGWGIF